MLLCLMMAIADVAAADVASFATPCRYAPLRCRRCCHDIALPYALLLLMPQDAMPCHDFALSRAAIVARHLPPRRCHLRAFRYFRRYAFAAFRTLAMLLFFMLRLLLLPLIAMPLRFSPRWRQPYAKRYDDAEVIAIAAAAFRR